MKAKKNWVEMSTPKDLDDLKKQHDKMVAEHGEPKQSFITIPQVCDSVENLVVFIFNGALRLMQVRSIGSNCNMIEINTSKELNEKLKDIPENKDTWDYIYDIIPPCFMRQTIRAEAVDGGDSKLIVITRLDTSEGMKMAQDFVKKVGLIS